MEVRSLALHCRSRLLVCTGIADYGHTVLVGDVREGMAVHEVADGGDVSSHSCLCGTPSVFPSRDESEALKHRHR